MTLIGLFDAIKARFASGVRRLQAVEDPHQRRPLQRPPVFYHAPTLPGGTHAIHGVCSTGYNGSVSKVSNLEIKCVDHVTGAVNVPQASSLATLRSNSVSPVGSSPAAWGCTLAWGTLEFDVDIELLEVFDAILVDADENQVYPSDGSAHSIITDATTIYLGDIPTTYPSLTVLVTVEARNDPWAQGEQKFFVQVQRAPRLIE